MECRSDCVGVLRQLVRLLYQSDDSVEAETVRRECFEGKNRVKTLSSNGDLSVCLCEFSNMQISTSQKLRSVQHCTVRYVLKHHLYINICISNTFYVNV